MKADPPASPHPIDPHRGEEQARVALTLHIARESFELLRDAALAGQLANVAERSHPRPLPGEQMPSTVDAVVEMLIAVGRPWLEGQAETIRRPGKI